MPTEACSEKDFIHLVKTHGVSETARIIGVGKRTVHGRRANLEKKYNTIIGRLNYDHPGTRPQPANVPGRIHYQVQDGVVLVGSDAHYWPGIITTAHRGLVKFCETLRPKLVIMNGDAIDGSTISRHPPLGKWEDSPPLVAEIEATKERLEEIRQASKKSIIPNGLIWPLGNHDGRFESRLQQVAPEYAKINGFHLSDFFPAWQKCWSVWINDTLVVKHRNKGGEHAASNNTKASGKSICTGHLHSLQIRPWTDYLGTRFGIDCGTLSEPFGPQFEYLEDNPRSWRSGFVVFTFRAGQMMWPEIASVMEEGVIDFRGEAVSV